MSLNDDIRRAQMDAGERAVMASLAGKGLIAAAPTFDLIDFVKRQVAFSRVTFGPGMRTEGLIDHITKELREIAAAPHDLEEYVDVVMLALDGAWRAGHSTEAIAAQLDAKLKKNTLRTWPDWRTAQPGKAIEHLRAGDHA